MEPMDRSRSPPRSRDLLPRPPAPRPARHTVRAKHVLDKSEISARDLLKDKLKSKLKSEMDTKFKSQKEESDIKKLEDALDTMHVSSTHKKARYEGGWYHIHEGERGGKYIIVRGQKKYLPRKTK